MDYKVRQNQNFNVVIDIPGSKSITNRALILGALSNDNTLLKNVLFSDDTKYMIGALEKLGYRFLINEEEKSVQFLDIPNKLNTCECFVGNAGTAMRFLPSLISVKNGNSILTGIDRMKNRPIKDLGDALTMLGVNFEYLEKDGYPPIKVYTTREFNSQINIKGDLSSQYITSLLLTLPSLTIDTQINIIGELVSKPYVNITLEMLKSFGVEIKTNADMTKFNIRGNQNYRKSQYIIEPDCSGASYFLAAAAVANGRVRIENINKNSLQGDIKFAEVLEKMGANVQYAENYIEITGTNKLKGISIDMNHIPDVAQTLAVVALFAEGKTEVTNVYNMRIKETDRIKAVCTEINRLGGEAIEKEDGFVIYPKSTYNGAMIKTYDDHRMAMSFAVAGLLIEGIIIKEIECVNKTFPTFFNEFDKLVSLS